MIFITRYWNNDFVLKMKNRLLSLWCGVLAVTTLFSCTDDNTIGLSMQPEQDNISVSYTTIPVATETILKDGVNLRNSLAVLGEFTDPQYGTIKSDFMSQLYCPIGFNFPDDVEQIDSAYMYLYYTSWFGDSSVVHHMNVYELDLKSLDRYTTYLSNADPNDYCSKTKLIASGSFSTGDFGITDSARALSTYQAAVRVPLDMDVAEAFLAKAREDSTVFSNSKRFQDYFKGIYVTTDYGNGSLLYITRAEIEMCYDTYLYSNTMGLRDSLVVAGAYFPVNKEVKQVNTVKHRDLSEYVNLTATDTLDYIYAPGGMYTKVTIPDSIFTTNSGLLSGKVISGLNLTVNATQVDDDDDDDYDMDPPTNLLLIDTSKVESFFSGFNLNDGLYSFVATYDSDEDNYVFDLSYYAQKMIREKDDSTSTDFTPFNDMLLIPVTLVQNDDDDYVRTEHVITPQAVKICSASHPYRPMKLEVVYSKK
jgi:hypothetical protein